MGSLRADQDIKHSSAWFEEGALSAGIGARGGDAGGFRKVNLCEAGSRGRSVD